jgi:hypothetical protein
VLGRRSVPEGKQEVRRNVAPRVEHHLSLRDLLHDRHVPHAVVVVSLPRTNHRVHVGDVLYVLARLPRSPGVRARSRLMSLRLAAQRESPDYGGPGQRYVHRRLRPVILLRDGIDIMVGQPDDHVVPLFGTSTCSRGCFRRSRHSRSSSCARSMRTS